MAKLEVNYDGKKVIYDNGQTELETQGRLMSSNLNLIATGGLILDGPYNSFEDLPAQGDSSKIYLVSVSSSESNNIYEEYIYINNSYELIGTTEVDLSDYLQPSDVIYTPYYQAFTDVNSGIKTGTLKVGSKSYDLNSSGEVGYTVGSTIILPRYTKWIKSSVVGDKLWTDSFIFYTTNAASINSAGKIGSRSETVALDTTINVSENSIYAGKISGGRLFCARLSGGTDANWNVSQGVANGLRDYVTIGADSFDSVGSFSTIEGTQNSAKGSNSHTEGLGNNATSAYMHVFGTYNFDPASGATSGFNTKGTYVEIVGNGTANSARHNARTLDWSGNEWLAGKLTVGAAPTNDMDVTTKQYVDSSLPNVLKFYYTTTSSSSTYWPNKRLPYKVDLPSDWENLIVPSIRFGSHVAQIEGIDFILRSITLESGGLKFSSNGSCQVIISDDTISGYVVYIHSNVSDVTDITVGGYVLIDSTDGSLIYITPK